MLVRKVASTHSQPSFILKIFCCCYIQLLASPQKAAHKIRLIRCSKFKTRSLAYISHAGTHLGRLFQVLCCTLFWFSLNISYCLHWVTAHLHLPFLHPTRKNYAIHFILRYQNVLITIIGILNNWNYMRFELLTLLQSLHPNSGIFTVLHDYLPGWKLGSIQRPIQKFFHA